MPWYLGEGGFLILGAVVYSVSFFPSFFRAWIPYLRAENIDSKWICKSLNLSNYGSMKKTNIKKVTYPRMLFSG